tara:strand:- start:12414 stop:12668 length:255 start_codon:yes stop_codon:yes gene_type:complete
MSSLDPKAEGWIPVDGHEGLWRDPITNAIVNTNRSEYDKYMEAHRTRAKKDASLESLQTEVNDLKSDLGDIKDLLLNFIKENKQ